MRVTIPAVLLAMAAAGCSQTAPAPVATTPEGANPAIINVIDQGNPDRERSDDPDQGVRRVVVMVSCPAGRRAIPCGAAATRDVAVWLADHGASWGERQPTKVTDLLINIDTDAGAGGIQLKGQLGPAAEMRETSDAQILDRFAFNGAGEVGEADAAAWCSLDGKGSGFCERVLEEECSPMAAEELWRICPKN